MDEKTPHIHATVIPVVTGERRKAKHTTNQEYYRELFTQKDELQEYVEVLQEQKTEINEKIRDLYDRKDEVP